MTSTYFLVLIAFFSVIYFHDEVKAECGGLIVATNGTITSPLYPDPYPINQNCTWEIKIPVNKSIWLHFKDFELEEQSSCNYDSVTLKSKRTNGLVLEHGKYCDEQVYLKSFNFSDSKIVWIEFKTDGSNSRRGFKVDFFNVPCECGGMVEGSEGIIASPRFPLPYPPDLNCTWNIQAPLNNNIRLTFIYFKTGDSSECVQDHVTVQSKMADGEIREHGKFCGEETPPVIFSNSNLLQIQFLSHTNLGYKGFIAKFIYEGCGGLIERGKGNISTPFFPNLYPPNKMCEWTILVPPQHKIKLYFLHFETEEGNGCPNDFLQIQSNSTDGKIHDYGKYCGNLKPPLITSKDSLILKFVSDRSFHRKGFMAEFSIDKLTDFESSISSVGSTTPVYEPLTSTAVNQLDITTEFVTSTNVEEHTLSDEYESSNSSTAPPIHTPSHPATESQQKVTENRIMTNDTNILSALSLLTKKVAEMEERQTILFNNYENMLNKVNRLLTSKNTSLEEKMFRSH